MMPRKRMVDFANYNGLEEFEQVVYRATLRGLVTDAVRVAARSARRALLALKHDPPQGGFDCLDNVEAWIDGEMHGRDDEMRRLMHRYSDLSGRKDVDHAKRGLIAAYLTIENLAVAVRGDFEGDDLDAIAGFLLASMRNARESMRTPGMELCRQGDDCNEILVPRLAALGEDKDPFEGYVEPPYRAPKDHYGDWKWGNRHPLPFV